MQNDVSGRENMKKQLTSNLNTKDWLRSTKGMRISAYIERDMFLLKNEQPFTKGDFEQSLKEAARPRKKS